MEIRPATDSDIPGIVNLLKVSLGESLMPKSEAYWRWKHIDNPFGLSPVLLAVHHGNIVGVRAFLRWNWIAGDKKIEAVRAVDTATHPDHYGKGIFKRLTLTLLNECEQNSLSMVYNTPNEKSRPGYLKMGWRQAGRFPVAVSVVRPWNVLRNLRRHTDHAQSVSDERSVETYLSHSDFPELLSASRSSFSGKLSTDHSPLTLNWRYSDVPVARYFAGGIENHGQLLAVIFYRMKKTRFGMELRVADFFLRDRRHLHELKRLVREHAKLRVADFVTFGGLSDFNPVPGPWSVKANIGPVVTVREIGSASVNDFEGFSNWSPSLGDLELF